MRHLITLLLLLCTLPIAALAETPTAEWNLNTDMNSYAGFGAAGLACKRGQSFLATSSGTLSSVSFRLFRNNNQPAPDLQIELYAVDPDGLPTGPALHSAVFATDQMGIGSPPVPTDFVLTGARPYLVAGSFYAVILSSPSPTGNPRFTANGSATPANDYEFGGGLNQAVGETAWTFIGNDSGYMDFGFRVMVDDQVPVADSSWGALKGRHQEP